LLDLAKLKIENKNQQTEYSLVYQEEVCSEELFVEKELKVKLKPYGFKF